MADKIIIDVNIAKTILITIEDAEADIDDARGYLKRVPNHLAWRCKEKTKINDGVNNCERDLKKIDGNTKKFRGALKAAVEEFSNAQNTSKNDSLWDIIQNAVAIVASTIIRTTPLVAVPIVADIISGKKITSNSSIDAIKKSIKKTVPILPKQKKGGFIGAAEIAQQIALMGFDEAKIGGR